MPEMNGNQSSHREEHQSSSSSSQDCDVELQEGSTSLPTAGTTNNTTRAPPPSDKTISCVSCRKRKLKCDRVKPKCGTCSRLRQECEYPERKRNLGSKRRNMKELEARLAEVETRLVSEAKTAMVEETLPMNNEADWGTLGMDLDMNMDMGDSTAMGGSYGTSRGAFDGLISSSLLVEDFFSHELLALGLQEPLPPQDMQDELHTIYFNTFHLSTPIIHKYRYLASLDRAPHMRPPVCLRYAMWTMAASASDKYAQYEDILYERTRRYLQMDEMKGHGEAFVDVYHAQAWCITATYEAKKTYFSRSWMSVGRITRLVHMLGLHRLDGDNSDVKRILQPPKDWIELEERRRTFWGAYYCDRWASSGTGWPMLIQEREIFTNLPASEEAFENGIAQTTCTLSEALTPSGASKVTPFGGIILSATLFGHNFEHLHHIGPNESPEDLVNGDFWKRHRKMDNVLSNTFMYLPDHLRLPGGAKDMNVIFLHMNIHASSICLHQAAILTAEKHGLDKNFLSQCRSRCVMAADEIANIMRLVSHIDVSGLNSWTGFCLYVAAGVFIQDAKLNGSRSSTILGLEFVLSAMKALGRSHSITSHFTAQLELDIDAAGIFKPSSRRAAEKVVPNIPINGLLAEREGLGMTMDDLKNYAAVSGPPCGDAVYPGVYPKGSNSGAQGLSTRENDVSPATLSSEPSPPEWDGSGEMFYHGGFTTTAASLAAPSSTRPSIVLPNYAAPHNPLHVPNDNMQSDAQTIGAQKLANMQRGVGVAIFPESTPSLNKESNEDHPWVSNLKPRARSASSHTTSPSDTSTPNTNTMQFPYRQAHSRGDNNASNGYNQSTDKSKSSAGYSERPDDIFIFPTGQGVQNADDGNSGIPFEMPGAGTQDFQDFLKNMMYGNSANM